MKFRSHKRQKWELGKARIQVKLPQDKVLSFPQPDFAPRFCSFRPRVPDPQGGSKLLAG
jgi:hypothetical protein